MEKRVLLAVVLSFLVLSVYQRLVPQPRRTPPQVAEETAAQPSGAAPATPSPQEPVVPDATPAAPAPDTGADVAEVTAETSARQIVVETNVLRGVFSNRGAVIQGWTLLRYDDDRTGRPIDLVPDGLDASVPRPFSLRLPDADQTARLNDAFFRADAAGTIDGRERPVTITFEYEDESGLVARKAFTLQPDSYIVAFSLDVSAGGQALNPVVQWGPGLGDSIHVASSSGTFGTYSQPPQGILYVDDSVERLSPSAVAEQPTYQGDFPFAGIDDHYFLASLVRPGVARITYQPVTAPLPEDPTVLRNMMAFDVLFAEPPNGVSVFFGPKDFDVLEAVDRELVRTIHYGIFSFLAVPLLRSLKWINGFVGNYGWSIIILTVLINLLMFPLRHKSVVSMRKMQALQPQMKAIQDRYAKLKVTDPARQKMNQEVMELYRQKGVNPASGCVPMLLTMPILFAFYSMLSVAIEIRGEPFALWITDLSKHDPLYITPVLMGITMLLQQRMTPIADPAQQKMMMIMPVMFLVFFLWAPSGLVLYWLMSNVLAIGQQYLTNRMIGAPVVKQVRPPAERRLKQAGTGRSPAARTNQR
jgi:YidC/Oxa1 family membrane protein insertase